jgi:hypothetical protein
MSSPLVAALLSFYFRVTLTADHIELRAVPFFRKSYPLSSVVEVPSTRLADDWAKGRRQDLIARAIFWSSILS